MKSDNQEEVKPTHILTTKSGDICLVHAYDGGWLVESNDCSSISNEFVKRIEPLPIESKEPTPPMAEGKCPACDDHKMVSLKNLMSGVTFIQRCYMCNSDLVSLEAKIKADAVEIERLKEGAVKDEEYIIKTTRNLKDALVQIEILKRENQELINDVHQPELCNEKIQSLEIKIKKAREILK